MYGGTRVTSSPSMMISPRSGSRKPAIRFSRVVLPQPEGPSRVRNSPLRTLSDTSLTAGVPSNDLTRPSTETLKVSPIATPSGGLSGNPAPFGHVADAVLRRHASAKRPGRGRPPQHVIACGQFPALWCGEPQPVDQALLLRLVEVGDRSARMIGDVIIQQLDVARLHARLQAKLLGKRCEHVERLVLRLAQPWRGVEFLCRLDVRARILAREPPLCTPKTGFT